MRRSTGGVTAPALASSGCDRTVFAKILIANRGEIACRVTRTARRMGIATVAVYSDADARSRHVALADEAFRIGPPEAKDSYLRGDRILQAAKSSGASAIHPGYGFLSENAEFAERCGRAGITFVGPPPEAIRAMGDKSAAKTMMERAGVPLVPGYHGGNQAREFLLDEAERIGFPVLIKAAAGGGGKGMRAVEHKAEFDAALAACRREASSAFGDGRVLLEKYLDRPRHIEIQVFADRHGGCIHLFERDCSVQRRHQKVLEEAPAPGMTEDRRQEMGEAALLASRAAGYVGAGTVEFIVDRGGAFFFIEMNTRLQVEHAVTEMITGLDLVEWQLRIAAGEKLPLAQEDLAIRGHAIEARLYAEDPDRGFLPQIGRLTHLAFAEGENIRVDAGVRAGDAISVYYDPMIAKLIVWGADRDQAIRRFRAALTETQVGGLKTNIAFLARLAGHPAFKEADLDTRFIERHQADLLAPPRPASDKEVALAALGLLLKRAEEARQAALASADPWSPWAQSNGWRLNDEARRELRLRELSVEGESETLIEVVYRRRGGWKIALANGARFEAQGATAGDGQLSGIIGDEKASAIWLRTGNQIQLFTKDGTRRFAIVDPLHDAEGAEISGGPLGAPMPGRVISPIVDPGAHAEANEPVIVLEAMKMEHTLRAPSSGTVVSFRFAAGEQVDEGAELVEFHADES